MGGDELSRTFWYLAREAHRADQLQLDRTRRAMVPARWGQGRRGYRLGAAVEATPAGSGVGTGPGLSERGGAEPGNWGESPPPLGG